MAVGYLSDFMLAAWGGTLVGGETWSGSMKFGVPAEGTSNDGPNVQIGLVDNDSAANQVLDTLKTFVAAPASHIPNNVKLTWFKWNRLKPATAASGAPTAHYVHNYTRLIDGLEVVGGQNPGYRYPTQVCWAWSWQTDSARGAAAKGRTFWPTVVPLVSASGQVHPDDALGAAVFGARLIKSWGNWEGIDATNVVPVIGSAGSQKNPAAFRAITACRVGTRLDTQRSRAEQLSEVYSRTLVASATEF